MTLVLTLVLVFGINYWYWHWLRYWCWYWSCNNQENWDHLRYWRLFGTLIIRSTELISLTFWPPRFSLLLLVFGVTDGVAVINAGHLIIREFLHDRLDGLQIIVLCWSRGVRNRRFGVWRDQVRSSKSSKYQETQVNMFKNQILHIFYWTFNPCQRQKQRNQRSQSLYLSAVTKTWTKKDNLKHQASV